MTRRKKPLICEAADVKQLIAATILQGVRDARGKNNLKALSAALWLTGRDFPLWAEAVGMPDADGLMVLTRGRLGRIEHRE